MSEASGQFIEKGKMTAEVIPSWRTAQQFAETFLPCGKKMEAIF